MRSNKLLLVLVLIAGAVFLLLRLRHCGGLQGDLPKSSRTSEQANNARETTDTPAVKVSEEGSASPVTTRRSGLDETSIASTNVVAAVEKEAVAPPTIEPVATNLPLPRFVGGHRANVAPGGALVLGGWKQPNGNRLLIFASPEPQADGKTVKVSSRFLSLPPSRLTGGGWEKFMADDAVASAGGVFSAAEYRETMKAVGEFTDVDVLSSPSLTTRYGQQAMIEIGSETLEQTADGTQLKRDGISQAIIARQIEGSADVDLASTAALFNSKP